MSLTKQELEEEEKLAKKKKGPISYIITIIIVILLLFAAFETIIAYLNFGAVRNDEEPKYFYKTITETENDTTYTIYKMRLYKIVKKVDSKQYSINLMPFFMNHK